VEAASAGGSDGTWEGVSAAVVRLAGESAAAAPCSYVFGFGSKLAASVSIAQHAPHPAISAHVLVHRFVLAGGAGGGRPGGPPPPPPPCDEKLMRALAMLHVPPELSASSSSAAAAAAKLLALLPPPVRIDRGECARLLLQLQVRAMRT
jgi:hypothetical protein